MNKWETTFKQSKTITNKEGKVLKMRFKVLKNFKKSLFFLSHHDFKKYIY
jgi:hypothetical protein